MKKKFNIKWWAGISCLVLIALGIMGLVHVKAATSDYYFKYNNVKYSDGSTIELKSTDDEIWISNDDTGVNPTSVQWTSKGDEVITLAQDATYKTMAKITRNGPGYSDITVVITEGSQVYNIQCKLKVDFEVDTSNFTQITLTGNRALLFKDFDDTATNNKDIVLHYTNSPSQIISNTNSSLSWTSSDNKIATVTNGKVTAVGAGIATIKIATNSVSTDIDPLVKEFTVIVAPQAKDPDATSNPDDFLPYIEVESNQVTQITTNASDTSKLDWEFYDSTGLTKINPEGVIDYSVFNDSTFTINSAKAGTYYIRGYVDDTYKPSSFHVGDPTSSAVPYLEIKLIVPIKVNDSSIVMNVGDTYSILENSNIPSVGYFNYSTPADNSTVTVSGGIIKANHTGESTVTLTKGSVTYTINVTVIDAIALNTSSVNIYTSSTILLEAITSNRTATVNWTSSNPSVATVDNGDNKGLVTGVSKGTTVITASQTVNGVLKTATCTVYVQESVNKITLDPAEVVINIDDYKTIKATIEPTGLNNVKLKWTTSDEDIVTITDTGNLTATIQGVDAGTAVITAINAENVVVGYCQVTVKQKVTGITLSATSLSLLVSDKNYQLRAIVAPDDATDPRITWKSTNANVATVNETGLVTLKSPGTTAIIATSVDDPSIIAICNINVGVSIASIKLDETSKVMYVGDTARLSYLITPTNATNANVTWSSTNTSVVTVDANGLVTAKGTGMAIIILKTSDGAYMSTCTITVKQKATGIDFDVSDLELTIGQTYTLEVVATPADATDYDLEWKSLDTTIATVDDKGTVTGKAVGKTTIIATASTGAVVYCTVTVKAEITGLQLNFKEKTIVIGESFDLKASVVPSAAADDVNVVYTSSKTSVATVSASGKVKGLKGGTAIITVTTDDGKYTTFCVVSVVERVTSITLNKTSYKLGKGKTYTLVATVKTNAATNPKLKWTSSNTKIATVDQKGKVTGKALGTVTITAAAQDGSGETATASIRVVTAVTSVRLNKSTVTTVVGRSFTLTAKIYPSNATYKTATWKSSDESIAIVDSDGVVTALKAGNVTIKASAKDNSGKYASCYVIVQPRVPSNSVTIINQNLTMVVGETSTLQKAINPSTSTDTATWESDNKTVASVNTSTGKVTAKTPGIATITVMTESGKTATTRVTVVGLNTTSLVLEQYTNYTLSVIGVTTGVTWDIDDSEIAVVTNGRVSTRRLGTTTITAIVNGRRLTCKLTVVKIK